MAKNGNANLTKSSATIVETKDIRKETVQSSRKVRPLVLETENHLADLEGMDLVDLDLEKMELAEMETCWTGLTDAT